MTRVISIILLDDHKAVRSAVRAYFETRPDFEVVGEAASGEDIVMLVSELVPDIVLLELIKSDMDAIETIRRLKQISPRTQIVVLTSSYEDTYIFPAIKAGVVSYNLKNMKMEWLAEELRRVYQGELRLHPHVATLMLQKICDEKGGGLSHFIELTDRELDVLKLISNGLTHSQIAEKLVIGENMSKRHISNLLSKLHLADRVQVVSQAWQRA